MATLTVGPQGTFSTLAAALAAAAPGDTILLQNGFNGGYADVTVDNLTFFGTSTSFAEFGLASGISNITFQGGAPFRVRDSVSIGGASGSNAINGNDGNNSVTVRDGVDVVRGGLGADELIIDYGSAVADVVGSGGQISAGAGRSVVFDGFESFRLTTGSGNDTITLGDGDQYVSMGAGNDTITLGIGAHEVLLGEGNNRATLGNGTATVTAGAGSDILFVGDGVKSLNLGEGNNQFTLGNGTASVAAGSGDDILFVGDGTTSINLGNGRNQVTAGNGANTITTGSGADIIVAGNGGNIVSSGGGDDSVTTGSGNDRVDGGAGNDSLGGGGGNDVLFGGGGYNTLNGGAGDDELTGGADDDVLAGGEGIDTASYADAIAIGPGGTAIGVNVSLLLQGQAQDTRFGQDKLTGIENLRGSSLADTLIGDGLANLLDGQDGDDTLSGGDGDDVLVGGKGSDTLRGGAGADAFRFAGDADATATAPDVIVDFQTGIDKLDLNAFTTLVNGIIPSFNTTTIVINGNNSTVSTAGGFGANITGILNGSDISYTPFALNWGLGGSYALTATVVRLFGDDNSNNLTGTANNDTINGGAGNDYIIGGKGVDTLAGGSGADVFLFQSIEDLPSIVVGTFKSTSYAMDKIADFETGVDKIDFSQIALTEIVIQVQYPNLIEVHSSSGIGRLDAPGFKISDLLGVDFPIKFLGSVGNDTIVGTQLNDVLEGLQGNDSLFGGNGNDTLLGGADHDTLNGDSGDDMIDGGAGIDVASYENAAVAVTVSLLNQGSAQDTIGAGRDTLLNIENLIGSAFNDTLTGGDGNDTLNGGGGDDRLTGGAGIDVLRGGVGADIFVFTASSDSVVAGRDTIADFETGLDRLDIAAVGATAISLNRNGGNATLLAATPGGAMQIVVNGLSQGSDLLTGGIGIDLVDDAANGLLVGTAAADRLFGFDGNDRLEGGGGNDQLFGDKGVDVLLGGAGADQFAYRGVADSNAVNGYDVIADFVSGTDKIDLYYLNGLQTISMNRLNGGTIVFASTTGGQVQIGLTNAIQGTDLINPFGTAATFGYDLVGEGANETLIGSSGNDRIFGLAGNDGLEGGAGNDQLFGDAGADLIFGGVGADNFAYRGVADSNATTGYDVIADFVSGQDKLDLYYLNGVQAVSLSRVNGDTFMFVSTATGVVQVGMTGVVQGTDLVNPYGSAATFGYDLVGEGANETLIGSAGNDRLFGLAGADTLQGGLGADLLYGGAGADSFRFTGAADSNAGAYDIIGDFETGIDRIDLRGSGLGNVGIAQSGGGYFVFAAAANGAVFQLGVTSAVVLSDILTGAATGNAAFAGTDSEKIDRGLELSDFHLTTTLPGLGQPAPEYFVL